MATIVDVDCTDGALLAGDRLVVEDGVAVGSRPHVFAFDGVGAAAVGDDPDGFRRQLEAALREYALERGDPGIDAASRIAADLVEEADVEAFVVARDGEGRARVRAVTDGVLEADVTARGSAAEVVLGQLETVGDVDLETAETRVREAFRAGASRDPGTGDDPDVWQLADG